MRSRRLFTGVGLVAVTAVASLLAAPELPAQLTAHWNAAGTPDGTLPATAILVGGPALVASMVVLFELIPRIDPLGENIRIARTAYDAFALLTAGVVAYLHLLILVWNLGYTVEIYQAIAPAIAVLYIGSGYLMERVDPNWSVGVRTPWTLSSKEVWDQTHQRTAPLLKLVGVLALGGLVAPPLIAAALFVVPVLLVAAFSIGYSYIIYHRIEGPTPE